MEGGAGRGKSGQGQQRRERRLTIDIRQIQGIYTPKTAWQKGMADRHPLLCVCSVFIGLVLRDGVQVCLYIFGFLGPLGLDSGRFTTPFLKCVSSNFSKKTNNPNPSPIKKIRFGLYLFGAGGGTRTHTPLRITDFESVSSANSDTPAFIFLSRLPMSCPRNRRDIVEGH